MEMQQVDGLDAELLEREFALGEQMGTGEVITYRGADGAVLETNTTFGRDGHLGAQAGVLLEDPAEDALGLAVAIDVGVVEERVTRVDRREDRRLGRRVIRGGVALGGDTPAAIGEATRGQRALAEGDGLHTPCSKQKAPPCRKPIPKVDSLT